jgi:hypothetical protein
VVWQGVRQKATEGPLMPFGTVQQTSPGAQSRFVGRLPGEKLSLQTSSTCATAPAAAPPAPVAVAVAVAVAIAVAVAVAVAVGAVVAVPVATSVAVGAAVVVAAMVAVAAAVEVVVGVGGARWRGRRGATQAARDGPGKQRQGECDHPASGHGGKHPTDQRFEGKDVLVVPASCAESRSSRRDTCAFYAQATRS